jgi:predicted RNase H-like HicB family nuclease
MKFTIVLKEDKIDGGYNVSCLTLPGCHSQGETVDEAVENIRDAITGYLEVLNERAKTITDGKVMEVSV